MAAKYTAWNPEQPNDSGHSEDCVQLLNVYQLQWNDPQFSHNMRFICEAV